jgi:hypothetical protein
MTEPHPGVGVCGAVVEQMSHGGLSLRPRTGKVINRKKNVYRGIPISNFAPGSQKVGDRVAVGPMTGLSFRARLIISSVSPESHLR